MLNKTIVSQTEIFVNKPFWSQNFVNSSYPTPSSRPTKVEIPKELPKVSMVNTSLKKLKHHLAGFHVVIKERTTTTTITMLESEAYKTYHNYVAGEKILKPKYVKNKADLESSPKKKFVKASKGKRIKTSTKVTKPVKKKQPATTSKEKGLNVLSEVALSEAEQIKMATKRSLIQTHGSYASGSGVNEGMVSIPGFLITTCILLMMRDISWKSSDEDDDDEVNVNDNEVNVSEDIDDLNDDNIDNEERQDEEDKEEDWSDDEAYDDENQGANVEGEELDEEETNEEDEVNELNREVNVNLEGRDNEMTNAPQTNIQGIDSILNLNTESTSLVDVLVSMNVEMPPSSQKTLYKALVDAYETNKDILETYGDTVTFKRRRDDKDEDEEPSAGSNRGSKRRRAGKEPESTSAPKEKTSKSSGKSKEGSKSHQKSTGKSAQAE
ncbi:hypothetical protein Tco_1576969 [Tanacetum coccineum]